MSVVKTLNTDHFDLQKPEQKRTAEQEYQHQYYLKHRAQIKKRQDTYRREHLEIWRKSSRRFRQEHPDRAREINQKSFAKKCREDPETVKRWNREWNRRNPEKRRLIQQCATARHRARKYGAKGNATPSDIRELLRRQKHKCALCEKPFPPEGSLYRFDVDHIRSLRKGGTHYPKNLQLLCRKCNLKKDRR